MGTFWSIFGGVLCGLFTDVMDRISDIEPFSTMAMVLFGGACGFLGSLLDSLLGALLQTTYWDATDKRVHHSITSMNEDNRRNFKHISGVDFLNNEQVNFVSIVMTSWIGSYFIGPFLFR